MYNVATKSFLRSPCLRKVCLPKSSTYYAASRSVMTLKNHKYTAHATATGAGRNGEVTSNDLKLKLASPAELGGTTKGENPEQLFAMGYASCLLGAIQFVAGRMGKQEMAKKAIVHTSVHLGNPADKESAGFGIAVDIKVEGVDDELLKAGHEFCPYSRALKYGAEVNVSRL